MVGWLKVKWLKNIASLIFVHFFIRNTESVISFFSSQRYGYDCTANMKLAD